MSYDTPEYYEWRDEAEQKGLIHKAALHYYIDDSKQLYAVYIDGRPVPVPIFTYRDWIDVQDIEYPINSFDSTKISDYDLDNLESLAKIMGYRNDDDDPEIDDYMWNGDVFGVTNCTRQGINFDFVESDYYTVREHGARLEEELYRGLYEADFDPDASVLDIAYQLNETQTPYRDKVATDFETVLEFKNQPRMAGGNAVTIFNTGDTYKIPVIKRSSDVSESAGWWSPVPCGVFQPYDEEYDDPSLRDHLFKEYSEYFFDVEPEEPIPEDLDGVTELEDMIENDSDSSSLVFTSAGIDCKNTNVQFYGALVVDDPEYFEEYIEGQEADNWEVEEYRLVDVKDGDKIKSLMKPVRSTNPYNVMGLAESLFYLKEEYGAVIGVDLERI